MSKSINSLGLMSGTSGDGVDASVINSDGVGYYKVLINNRIFNCHNKSISIIGDRIEAIFSPNFTTYAIVYLKRKSTI